MAKEKTKPMPAGKLTYEELQNAANALHSKNQYLENQNQQLIMKVKELSDFTAFKRLDYLFKVLEFADRFPSDFVISCSEELQTALTIQPAEEEKKED